MLYCSAYVSAPSVPLVQSVSVVGWITCIFRWSTLQTQSIGIRYDWNNCSEGDSCISAFVWVLEWDLKFLWDNEFPKKRTTFLGTSLSLVWCWLFVAGV